MKFNLPVWALVIFSVLVSVNTFGQFVKPQVFYDNGIMAIENLQVSVFEKQSIDGGMGPAYLVFDFRTTSSSTTTDFVLHSSPDESELFLHGMRSSIGTGVPGSAPIHYLQFRWIPKVSKYENGKFIWLFEEDVPQIKRTDFGPYRITATYSLTSIPGFIGLNFKIENVRVELK